MAASRTHTAILIFTGHHCADDAHLRGIDAMLPFAISF